MCTWEAIRPGADNRVNERKRGSLTKHRVQRETSCTTWQLEKQLHRTITSYSNLFFRSMIKIDGSLLFLKAEWASLIDNIVVYKKQIAQGKGMLQKAIGTFAAGRGMWLPTSFDLTSNDS